jgi:hypothetical protein
MELVRNKPKKKNQKKNTDCEVESQTPSKGEKGMSKWSNT